MIRLLKNFAVYFTVVVLLISILPIASYAVGEIDQTQDVSLTLRFYEESETEQGKILPITDAQFDLFYVATVEGYGRYTLAGDFAEYPVEVNDLDAAGWRELTETLLYYVQTDALQPQDTGKTNAEGNLTFPNNNPTQMFTPGLYLVKSYPRDDGTTIYRGESFMVCLPGVDPVKNEWDYHMTTRVKYTKETKDPGQLINRRVLKVWEGDKEEIRPKEVEIILMKNDKVYDTVTLNEENDWKYLWKDLPKYDENETLIQWSVAEKEVEDYKFSVKLEQITFVVTNTYDPEEETGDTVRRVVQKTWDDKGYESKRPKSITVYLMKNGEKQETQTLSSSNGWKYTWEELPTKDKDGKEIKWTVTEAEISGYVVNIVQMGDNFILTNSVVKPSLPQTGVLWWPVPVLAAAGLMMLVLGRLLKGRKDDA